MSEIITEGPFAGLRRNGYSIVLCDPPWRFKTYSEKGEEKSPQMHYPCMDIEAIGALPVADLAAPDCVLIVWGISPMAPEALVIPPMEWGFQFKTKGVWAKQSSTGEKWAFGTGFILRGASEDFYIFTKGKPKLYSKGERNLIVAPVREHSRKPDEQYAKWENVFGLGRRIELFARTRWPGWEAWGNETGKFNDPENAEWLLDDMHAAVRRQRKLLPT